jgi:formiminotetrahydrofolate cyclodeaminase
VPDFETFFDELSSAAPVPGGGSVAALSTALGAALLVMVCNLTLGRKRYEPVRPQIQALYDRAAELRDRARRLANEDERAYSRVSAVMTLPRETEEQKAERRDRLQEALKAAAVPPIDTMRVASAVIDSSLELVSIGNRSAVSDVGSAALMAVAGYRAAQLNVEINLASVTDEAWILETRRVLGGIPAPGERNERVQAEVLNIIRGRTL